MGISAEPVKKVNRQKEPQLKSSTQIGYKIKCFLEPSSNFKIISYNRLTLQMGELWEMENSVLGDKKKKKPEIQK